MKRFRRIVGIILSLLPLGLAILGCWEYQVLIPGTYHAARMAMGSFLWGLLIAGFNLWLSLEGDEAFSSSLIFSLVLAGLLTNGVLFTKSTGEWLRLSNQMFREIQGK